MRIVVGVTGGIAAFKAVGVIRSLVEGGHDVQVIPTEAALRFVGLPTWEAISRAEVHTDLFTGVAEVRHVALGQGADAILIVPATANTIARLAAGLADDLLTNTVLASTAPLIIAPAMHTEMWRNAATRANIARLTERGARIVGPGTGRLTGSDSGEGRLVDTEVILAELDAVVSTRRDLAGTRILVSAGGTREPIDPVRFIGNRSSGRQGVAIAAAARARGAEVTLVAAHLEVPVPAGVRTIEVSRAAELESALVAEQPAADVVVMAAAVSDFRVAVASDRKISKQDTGEALALDLVQNPDILRGLVRTAPEGQRVVGFAAETVDDADELLRRGRAKRERKGADFLVLNSVGVDHGFVEDRNSVIVIDASGDIVATAAGDKLSVADRILDAVTGTASEPATPR
ncbi:bifunctional phosphopantothenoylcysteine decarboxylase/phosphopantothenate--cysteine ligase CoaBC [Mycetocola reblochoni]|uniref:Coenzyme A biosynthesis bifunctional protein CoaBC n=2 Tax=Mycetocola reblochoni TaxID=331618 RepID=A0A1R4J436_9MICO|nr:bifunctional phosphopantothenoylcysteine decarboxylase/phosphopantothenate--cysteine ligase CoaBC [Mycetocola reblochoni]RLP69519.1 bifunctional phosphopantothenoylcysteine decarboxylase/phosphopantothenate--cysteine ligase CoaBC [Mycetocola reblochoni]SJN26798.1 Phosphopantothenoylcysteine decarboxylase / Phosphopantothenoylcysteine synthetase [Mycetocola reblochoni REB411]